MTIRFTDILAAGGYSGDSFDRAWNSTEAAEDFDPLPSGTYVCRVDSGELVKSSKGTPGYKLTFAVLEGEYAGRKVWHDCWLTPAALPQTKRDLMKLAIDSPDKMSQPMPAGIRCSVHVVLRRDDDGIERNRVRKFGEVSVQPPKPDDFAPQSDDDTGERGDA